MVGSISIIGTIFLEDVPKTARLPNANNGTPVFDRLWSRKYDYFNLNLIEAMCKAAFCTSFFNVLIRNYKLYYKARNSILPKDTEKDKV